MNIVIHKTLPDGYVLAKSMFDFVKMHLWEDEGYTVILDRYILASLDGEFHEFTISDMTEYRSIEKYVKNNQCYVKKD